MSELLKLNNVNKVYQIGENDQFYALQDINASFDQGEIVSIVGESGSGKTSLMNIIGLLDTDYSGTVQVEGEDIGEYDELDQSNYHKEKVGFVFQDFHLVSHLSVVENVALAMTLNNVSKSERLKTAEETLKKVGLEDHLYKKPAQLSGGQKQRVAIARALVNDPKIILADEPTGALDAKTTEQILDILKSIADLGKLVIIVTHSEKVASISNRIVSIKEGYIVDDRQLKAVHRRDSVYSSRSSRHKQKPKSGNLSFIGAVKLAMKNMREKFSRNLLISIGASIGIMSIILMLALGEGVNNYLVDTMATQTNPLVTEVRMPGDEESNSVLIANDPFEESHIQQLAGLEGVEDYYIGYSSFVLGGNNIVASGIPYNFMNFQSISPMMSEENLAEGSWPSSGQILVTPGLADAFANDFGYSIVGSTVTINMVLNGTPVEQSVVVSGVYSSGESSTTSGMFDGIYLEYQDMVNMAANVGNTMQPTIVYLVSESEREANSVREAAIELGYDGSAMSSVVEIFGDLIDIFTYILAGIAGLSLIVSAIMILIVLHITVVERMEEIGVIKSIGGRKQDVKRIFVSESFLLGLAAGLLGIVASFVLSVLGNVLFNQLFGVSIFAYSMWYALIGLLVSILVSMLAGYLPAKRAADLDPIQALNND